MLYLCRALRPPQRSCRRWETGRSRTSGRPLTPGITRRSWPSWWRDAGQRTPPRGPTLATSRFMWPNSTSKRPLVVCSVKERFFFSWGFRHLLMRLPTGRIRSLQTCWRTNVSVWADFNHFDRGLAVCAQSAAAVRRKSSCWGLGSEVRTNWALQTIE